MTPTTDEKLNVVERLIEEWRWARDGHTDQRQVYEVLKSIAKELGARRVGAPGVVEVELERRMAAVQASKTSLGYAVPAMVGLAQELVGRWQTVIHALRGMGEFDDKLNRQKAKTEYEAERAGNFENDLDEVRTKLALLGAALNRWRYAYRWWLSDSYDVGGEMRARFNWAAGEDVGMQDLDENDVAQIGHEFLRATGRSTIKGVVQK